MRNCAWLVHVGSLLLTLELGRLLKIERKWLIRIKNVKYDDLFPFVQRKILFFSL